MFWLLIFFPLLLWAKPLEVDVSARSAILINAQTGAVLFEKEAHEPRYPASTTKVATALFLLEEAKLDWGAPVVVTREALRVKPMRGEAPPYLLDPEGSAMGLEVGDVFSVEELMHGMLMSSGNDAANMLAEKVGGTIPLFIDRMNAYLKGLGCRGTEFHNPHGLHYEAHRTTAFDLALMTRRALQYPQFRKIVSKAKWTVPGGKELVQTNHLVREGEFFDPRVIGVKTGFTSDAGYALVAAAEVEGRRLIAVVLEAPSRNARYRDVRALFDAAYGESKVVHPLFAAGQLFERPVEGGIGALRARLEKGLVLEYYPAEEPQVHAVAHWTLPELPIAAGAAVGAIRVLGADERVLLEGSLVATERVEETWGHAIERVWRQALSFW